MPKVISKGEKMLVYGFFGCIDVLQMILSIFVVTEIFNHIIDIAAGIILLLYGLIKKLWNGQKLAVLAAVFFGEQIPFVNALPFWTLDVRNLYAGTVNSESEVVAGVSSALNQDGVRAPVNGDGPLIQDGVRKPENSAPATLRPPGGGLPLPK